MNIDHDAIIDEFIKVLLPSFKENILNDEDLEELCVAFICKIKREYISVLNDISKSPQFRPTILIEIFSENLKYRWKKMSPNEKKSLLLKDPYLEELKLLSEKIFDLAVNAKVENIFINNEDEYKELIEKIEELIRNIKDYNLKIVSDIATEMILDINYAYGKSIEMSKRLKEYK